MIVYVKCVNVLAYIYKTVNSHQHYVDVVFACCSHETKEDKVNKDRNA